MLGRFLPPEVQKVCDSGISNFLHFYKNKIFNVEVLLQIAFPVASITCCTITDTNKSQIRCCVNQNVYKQKMYFVICHITSTGIIFINYLIRQCIYR